MDSNAKISLRHAAAISGFILLIGINTIMVWRSRNALLDFGSFIAAGKFANADQNPYATDSPLIFEVFFPGGGVGGSMPNLNPPISIPIFQILAGFDPYVTVNLWRIVAVVLYLAALVALLKTYRNVTIWRVGWALALAGFWHTIELGQIYTLLLLLTTLAIYFSEKKNSLISGISIGLTAAIKPNFALWILFLLASRNWRTGLMAAFVFTFTSLIPLFMYGSDVYGQWLSASNLSPGVLGMPGNSSLMGLTSRLGNAEIGAAISLILSAVSLVWAWRKHPGLQTIHELGLVASLISSPITWVGYTPLLLPIFLARKNWNPPLHIAAAILVVPFVFPLAYFDNSPIGFIVWGGWYGWGLLLIAYVVFSNAWLPDTAPKDANINNIQTN